MTCIIVDDDEMARVSLEHMCGKINDLTVVQTYENGLDAIEALKSDEIDLVFLDIQMPDMSGIDIIRSVSKLPQIIFISSHTEYAVQAFEHHVTDFLVKPIDLPRLIAAVDHAKKLHTQTVPTEELRELFVKVDGRLVRLNYDDILYVESIGDYVVFHTVQKQKLIVHSTLKNIDAKIQSPQFLKVHRGFVVNLKKVVDIEDTNLVIGDKVIPISRAHRPLLLRRIQTL